MSKPKYPILFSGIHLYANGYLSFTESEYIEYSKQFRTDYFVKCINGHNLITNTFTYWLKLDKVPESELTDEEIRRGKLVTEWRLKSNRIGTRKLAYFPYCYENKFQPSEWYLGIAKTFSPKHTELPTRWYSKYVYPLAGIYALFNPTDEIISILKSQEFFEYLKLKCVKMSSGSYTFTCKLFYQYLDEFIYN
jgi:hypothetical protein